ncbi:hypothetical protein FGO68_gene15342 [Halteria grandinella]|uniref:Uncharacterized protein n=1 Tax=Halteria grandinella TaxID=5974 RepID=A0A8J8P801_HALGN|nr:hypothetical protein FGO68_gene15342 [Halteria grandinella]
MKADTLAQIEEFEGFLSRQAKGQVELDTISEAKRQIEDAKSKTFGVKDLKEKFTGHEAEKLRQSIAQLKIEASNGKITKVALSQQLLALLFQLEKTGTRLTAEEVATREQCKSQGAAHAGGAASEIGEESVKILTSHSKDQIDNSRQFM